MVNPWNQGRKIKKIICLTTLMVLSLISSWLPYPGLYAFDWTITGIFILLILASFGVMWAGATVLIIYLIPVLMGEATFLHMIPSILEIIVVGWMTQRFKYSLVISDGLFWIVIGIPLTFVFYFLQTGAADPFNVYYTLNIGLNALICAFIADLIWTYSPLRRWLRPDTGIRGYIEYKHMVLQLSLAAIAIPFICYIGIIGYQVEDTVLKSSHQRLQSQATSLERELVTWSTYDFLRLRLQDVIQLHQLNAEMERVSSTKASHMVLIDQRGQFIAANRTMNISVGQPYNWRLGGSATIAAPNLYIWLPHESPPYDIELWRHSYLVLEHPVVESGMTVVLHQSFSSEITEILNRSNLQIGLLLMFLVITVILVLFLNRFLFKSLFNLAETSTGIPKIISDGRPITWPSSSIVEVDQLTQNFKQVTKKLESMFEESDRATNQLRNQKDQLAASKVKLQYLVYHDSLTGLPNRLELRRHLHMLLDRPLNSNGPHFIGVLFIDLDRFKQINDTLGHAIGDSLLQMVAGRFTSLRDQGVVISRHSGDEFVLVVDAENRADVEKTASQLISTLSDPFILLGQEVYVGASVGVAIYPEHGKDADTLMKNADSAMYDCKKHGGNDYTLYRDGINIHISEKMWLENNMHKAFEAGEFVLYFQLKVEGENSQLSGMETLVRWMHPEKGIISPATFIPVAEDTGFIIPLGGWILREACAQNKRWQDAGYPPLRVAVNLSARQFYNYGLLESVQSILQETGLEGKYLELEITEAFLIKDPDYVVQLVRDLSAMEIIVTIDDFGTGYSSLGQLKRFPVHSLKIDRSFISGIENDKDNDAIVRSMIQLAHNMNLKVVGEGIETNAEKRILRSYGCDVMQGFLFGKPVSAIEFESILKGGHGS